MYDTPSHVVYIQLTNLHSPIPNKGASQVTQWVKYPSAMKESQDPPLGWEDPLEEGMATLSSILAWRIPMGRGAWVAIVHGVAKSRTRLSDKAHS